MRYFLLDQITELVPGEQATGIKCVTLADETLHDHFPDFPTHPGAMIVEGAAQLAGFLVEMSFNKPDSVRRALLTQIELARFHGRAGPGTRLEIIAKLVSFRDPSAQLQFEARDGDRRIARGVLMFMLQSVDSERLHEQRRTLYRLWMREFSQEYPVY